MACRDYVCLDLRFWIQPVEVSVQSRRTIWPLLGACLMAHIATAVAAESAATCLDVASAAPVRWVALPLPIDRRILRVGPGRELDVPSAAARVAREGDIVLIDAGSYVDTAVWRQNDLWIRGVGGRPHLRAPDRLAQDKAIWVISGKNVTIENVEMSGARVPDRNGAGIRAQGQGLTVRAACFHDNENGILSSNESANWMVVEFSEFSANGGGDGRSHNLYVGRVGRFEMRHSYSHGARVGHLVKSRAARNVIEYNRLVDDEDGTASYELDLPAGGDALVRGNLISQSASSPNQTIVSYAAEKKAQAPGRLIMLHNTLVSRRRNPVFVANLSSETAVVVGNLFAGVPGTHIRGTAQAVGNRYEASPEAFVDFAAGDFRLRSGCPPGPQRRVLEDPAVLDLVPDLQPLRPLGSAPRRADGSTTPGGAFDCL